MRCPPSSTLVSRIDDGPEPSATTEDDDSRQAPVEQHAGAVTPAIHTSGLELKASVTNLTVSIDTEVTLVSSDLWSAAYREAVESLGKDINVAIPKGDSVAQLFKQLENRDKDASQGSVFLRGVRYLHSLQAPLERFKLALDVASPLTSLEPTVATAFGVDRVRVAKFGHARRWCP
jgi:hypothetical protein